MAHNQGWEDAWPPQRVGLWFHWSVSLGLSIINFADVIRQNLHEPFLIGAVAIWQILRNGIIDCYCGSINWDGTIWIIVDVNQAAIYVNFGLTFRLKMVVGGVFHSFKKGLTSCRLGDYLQCHLCLSRQHNCWRLLAWQCCRLCNLVVLTRCLAIRSWILPRLVA